MTVRDTSREAFDRLAGSGVKETLLQMVFAAVCDIGPVHNLRLLEYLQQREKQKPKASRIEWTTNNCWPRVTELVAAGQLFDLGTFRGIWYGKKKTLHFRAARGQYEEDVPSGWTKVERIDQPIVTDPGVPTGAQQSRLF